MLQQLTKNLINCDVFIAMFNIMETSPMPTLRLILGDQLNTRISSLRDCEKEHDIVLMCEIVEETQYVKHHKKKIALIFSAMRHFALELGKMGYQVDYVKLDDIGNTGSFTGEVSRAINRHNIDSIVVTSPGEYRILQDIQGWPDHFAFDVDIREDDRFLCRLEEFQKWTEGRKQLRMEHFYHAMRRKFSILMTKNHPTGGQWNFDANNRKRLPKNHPVPQPYKTEPDNITQDVLALVEQKFSKHFGDLLPFTYAVTRRQALAALELFVTQRLPLFGDYQDAMTQGEPWMFHSHLSFYLNCGLLLPKEVIEYAEKAYKKNQIPLASVEGFIRQILGWREYVRGIYWLNMPKYAELNYFDSGRQLPAFYWTGKTRMNCLRQCIQETRENAYAHHIQRLMILGNFALLTGVHPKALNEWFLIVYADAYEWVVLPNVSGMVLYADGGYLTSKPYFASGAYINKMSDYCRHCNYQVKQKNGPEACPFNYLYWNFAIQHRQKLAQNLRLTMTYKQLDKMDTQRIENIRSDSHLFFQTLEAD